MTALSWRARKIRAIGRAVRARRSRERTAAQIALYQKAALYEEFRANLRAVIEGRVE